MRRLGLVADFESDVREGMPDGGDGFNPDPTNFKKEMHYPPLHFAKCDSKTPPYLLNHNLII